jgi:F1F0 ATPase subunit 2
MLKAVDCLFAFSAGMALGALHFTGLWLTVRRLPDAAAPLSLLLASFLARTAVAASGLILVMDGRWERLIAALAGFIVTREMLSRLIRRRACHP